jgi:hypothetical protein
LSKFDLANRVPDKYERSTFVDIIRAICGQSNSNAEGKLVGRYQSQSTIPSSVAAAVGDVVWNTNPTVINGTVTGSLVGNYIIEKWICTVGNPTNATWKEVRVLTP